MCAAREPNQGKGGQVSAPHTHNAPQVLSSCPSYICSGTHYRLLELRSQTSTVASSKRVEVSQKVSWELLLL